WEARPPGPDSWAGSAVRRIIARYWPRSRARVRGKVWRAWEDARPHAPILSHTERKIVVKTTIIENLSCQSDSLTIPRSSPPRQSAPPCLEYAHPAHNT